jgi:hypothetical protein
LREGSPNPQVSVVGSSRINLDEDALFAEVACRSAFRSVSARAPLFLQ